MAQREYKIKLSFQADTEIAKREVNSLGEQLNQIINKKDLWSSNKLSITKNLEQAKHAASELQIALKSAFDTNTGQLNFSKFNKSLAQGGLNAASLRKELLAIGSQGQTAFMTLTKAIINAEVPSRRLRDLLGSFGTTLVNNFKWLVSSNLLQGVTGAINEAYQYAQDLDESLNDIRIVTSKSTQDMNKFAKAANEAAKALSTTTTEYTDAALIFYQQGLDDKSVKQRTDTVIKMANVTGEAAEDVSSYMTAIWNNFDDGSKSLEHYADVITALGAATASSSEEIAGGLEKFAAIADTVGLSYEYATAALATVVAETRQSEETVGTSFKTIFGRLQSLSLGETLDDDTTLTKYSAALEKVGVNIKNQAGQLKSMDTILDELGEKWNNLNSNQKTALANTVAGTRQYANFIALMDNYQKVQENVQIARSSEGELQKQANIYAESWEAARDRVKAAAEELYDNLLNSEDFIELLRLAEKSIGIVARLVDGLGGIKGTLAAIATIALPLFKDKAADGLRKGLEFTKDYIGLGKKEAQQTKKEFLEEAKKAYGKKQLSPEQERELEVLSNELDIQSKILQKQDSMTERERQLLQIRQESLRITNEELKLGTEKIKILDQEAKQESSELKESLGRRTKQTPQNIDSIVNERYGQARDYLNEVNSFIDKKIGNNPKGISLEDSENFYQLANEMLYNKRGARQFRKEYGELKNRGANNQEWRDFWEAQNDMFSFTDRAVDIAKEKFKRGTDPEGKDKIELNEKEDALLTNMLKKEKERSEIQHEIDENSQNYNDQLQDINNTLDKQGIKTKDWAEVTVEVASAAAGVYTAFQAISNLGDVWQNDELSFWEKLGTTLVSVGTAIGSLIPVFKLFKTITTENIFGQHNYIASLEKAQKEEKESAAEVARLTALIGQEEAAQDRETASNMKNAQSEKEFANAKDNSSDSINNKLLDNNISDAVENIDIDKKDVDKIKNSTKSSGKKGAGKTATKTGTKVAGKGITKGGANAGGGAALGGMAMIAAAVGIAIGAVALTKYLYEKDAKEAKKAREQAEQLTQAYQQQKEELDKLKTSLDAYGEAQKNLKGLIKGTDEWKQSLSNANKEAQALLETYKGIIGTRYHVDGNGMIVIDEEALKDVENAQQAATASAMANANAMNIIATEKELKSKRTDLARKSMWTWKDWAGLAGATIGAGATGAGVGALAGGGLGTVVPGIGNAAGAAGVGAIAGLVTGLVAGGTYIGTHGIDRKKEKETLEDIADHYQSLSESDKIKFESDKEYYNQYIDELQASGEINEGLARELKENRTAIIDLSKTEDLLRKSIIEQTKQIVLGYNAEFGEGADSKETVVNMASYEAMEGGSVYNKKHAELSQGKKNFAFFAYGNKGWAENVENITDGRYRVTKHSGTAGYLEKYNENTRKWERVSEDTLKFEEMIEIMAADEAAREVAGDSKLQAELEEKVSKQNKEFIELLGLDYSKTNKDDKERYGAIAGAYLDKEKNITDYILNLTKDEALQLMDNLADTTDFFSQEVYKAASEYNSELQKVNKTKTEEWAKNQRINFETNREAIKKALDYSDAAFESYTETLKENNLALANNEEFTEAVAVRNLELIQGVEKLNSVLRDNIGLLLNGNETLPEYSKALATVTDALYGICGTCFRKGYMKSSGKDRIAAAEGDTNALRELQQDAIYTYIKDEWADTVSTQDRREYQTYASNTTNQQILDKLGLGTSLKDSGLDISMFENDLAIGDIEAGDLEQYFKLLGFQLVTDDTGKIDLTQTKYIGTSGFQASLEKILIKNYDGALQINDELDKTERKLEKQNQITSEAWGTDKIESLKEENNLIQQQINLYKDLRVVLSDNINKAKTDLNEYATKLGFTINYNDDGSIKEYTDTKTGKAYSDYYTFMRDTDYGYDTELENLIKEYLNSQKEYDENEVNIENLQIKSEDTLQSIDDYEFELRAQLSDKSLNLIENQLARLGDGYENAGRRMSLLGNKFEQYVDDARDINTRWQELQDIGSINKETMEDWEKLSEDVLTLEENIRDLVDAYKNELESAVSKVNEELEEQISMIDTLNSMTDTFKNIVDVVGREYMLDIDNILAEIDKTKMESSLTVLETTQAQYDAESKILEEMKNNLATARLEADTEAIDYWYEQIEAQEKKMVELQAQEASNFAEALQIAADNFTNTVDRAINNMEMALAGSFGSLEYMQSYYNQQQKEEELYLEDYEKTYELSKLARQVSGSINEMNNISAKQKLRDIQQEINDAMKEENKLSEHDLDILQKKYDLRLAEIALEDAQNAKTQVRLVQNASGTWSYIYTAEQEKVDQATQDYEDKLYALQKANEEYVDTWSNYILTLEQSFGEGLNKILNTTFSSREAQQKALNEYLQSQLLMLEAYGEMGEDIDFGQTIFANQFKDLPEMLAYIQQSFTGAFGIVTDALEEEYTAFDDITSRITDNDLAKYIGNNLDSVAIRSEVALQNVQSTAETLSNTYTDLANNLLDFQIAYADIMKEVMIITDQVGESVRKNLGDATGKVIVNIKGSNTGTVHATAYDTGGYTGAWGPEGKLAVLHEKELILNKSDTENMLKMLEIASRQININALNSVRNITDSISYGAPNGIIHDTIEQVVQVTAEFPNATNHFEIEQAFENIVNMASQYAHRK